MTIYENDELPPYNPPDKKNIKEFIENVKNSVETDNKKRSRDYDDPYNYTKNSKPHIDYRDLRKEYIPVKSSNPCWYLVNGFECYYSSNSCCFSHNPENIKRKKSQRIPELCKEGKGCKNKCRKYHKIDDLEDDFRKCKDIVYNQDVRIDKYMRDLRHMENKVLNLQRECIHWQNKHENVLKELEICERRSKAFEKIIVNNY